MKFIIEKLLDQQSMTQEEARTIMLKIMSGEYDDAQISGFLIALRAKGEISEEIAGFAQAMRDKMTKIESVNDAIDMCGTGGDSSGTFNISTTAAFVVAAAGVPVAKHGNRSMTSKSGSADVLTALGVDITLPPKKVSECIHDIGIGFMFAPSLHPAMKYAMGARVALGTRTVFNILGPLCNPAGVERQLMGIFDGSLTETVAQVLQKLGSVHAMIVHGDDGLDEISTTSSTKVSRLKNTGGVIGIAKSRKLNLSNLRLSENPLILIAEAPEKPGNIGALLRTADAAKLDAVIIANPKGDLYNPNIIRSSVGCLFTNQIATGTTAEIISFLKENDITIYCATLQKAISYHTVDYTMPAALVVGTESTGLSQEWRDSAAENIIIPMKGKIDSMNISVSASILIFEAKRQRGF